MSPRSNLRPIALRVCSLPELAEHIALYLAPIHQAQARLVCKDFYTTFIPFWYPFLSRYSTSRWDDLLPRPSDIPSTTHLLLQAHQGEEQGDLDSTVERSNSSPNSCGPAHGGNRLCTLVASPQDQLLFQQPILSAFPSLVALSLSVHGQDVGKVNELLSLLPNLAHLPLTFPKGALDPAGDEGQAHVESTLSRLRLETVGGGRGLKTLELRILDYRVATLSLKTLDLILRRCPSLLRLALHGFSLRGITMVKKDDSGQTPLTHPHVHLKNLALSWVDCSVGTMRWLDRLFPFLKSLEIRHSLDSDCLKVFGHDLSTSTTTPDEGLHPPVFTGLSQLRIVERMGTRATTLYHLIKDRPFLQNLETVHLTIQERSLLQFFDHCLKVGQTFERLVMGPEIEDFFVSIETMERMWASAIVRGLKHVFVHRLLPNEIPFSSTLTSLHIGERNNRSSDFEPREIPLWRGILQRLPCLKVLQIDRVMSHYAIFDGLGYRSGLLPEEEEEEAKAEENRNRNRNKLAMERPHLEELCVTIRGLGQVQTKDLDQQLIQRFRFLEKLVFYGTNKPRDYDGWRKGLRKGLKAEFRSYKMS